MAKLLLPIVAVFCLVGIVVFKFGFIFLLLALLPSLMAWFMDSFRGKPAFKTVFACNIAGVAPVIPPLMTAAFGMEYKDLTSVVANPVIWLMSYGGAAAGWCLVYLCRFVARLFITASDSYKSLQLERMQRKLVAEWGSEITKNPE